MDPHVLLAENQALRRRVDELEEAGAVERREVKYRQLIDLTDTGFCILDAEGRVLDANAEYVRLSGHWRLEEILGRRLYEWTADSEGEATLRAVQRCLEEGVLRGFETSNRTQSGELIPVELNATAVRSESGDRILSLWRDISARKQAEQALRLSEQKYRTIVEMSTEWIWELDLSGRHTFSNPAGSQLLGYRLEELSGMGLELIHPEDAPKVKTELPRLIEQKKGWRGWVVRWRHRDGTYRYLESNATPLIDAQGRLVAYLGADRDITERKKVEEEMRRADQRKTEFLAMLSHELRNPLTPIRNSLYILQRAPPGGEQAQRAQAVIARQVDHLSRLVDDLLDVTRINRGLVQLRREHIELNELAHRTVEDHRSLFFDAGIELETVPSPRELWVYGDRTRLSQVIGNLLQNAAKFTPAGGKTSLSVELDASRSEAVLTVRDTGSGIPRELMPRLFEGFAQADRTLDRSKGGLGLGLALVKHLIEMHGGSVSAQSEGPGRGAAFTVRLALEAPVAREPRLSQKDQGAVIPRRVLVIEDNADAAESLREVLELEGHSVAVSPDAPSGLAKARAFRPEVVFCDIGLPGMDGHEVARVMRGDPELAHITLVALTGYAHPEDVARAKQAGFDEHLAKPPDLRALERILTQAQSLRRQAR